MSDLVHRLHYHVVVKGNGVEDEVVQTTATAVAARIVRRPLQQAGKDSYVYECHPDDLDCPSRGATRPSEGTSMAPTEERTDAGSGTERDPSGDQVSTG